MSIVTEWRAEVVGQTPALSNPDRQPSPAFTRHPSSSTSAHLSSPTSEPIQRQQTTATQSGSSASHCTRSSEPSTTSDCRLNLLHLRSISPSSFHHTASPSVLSPHSKRHSARQQPPYRRRTHPTQPSLSAAAPSSTFAPQSIFSHLANPAFVTPREMSTEEIASSPPVSPSALEANEPKSNKSKNTDPILNESPLDQSSFPGRPPGLHPLTIPPLSPRQKFYILALQMIGAAALDGLFNFAIGCAMYLNAKSVRIWILAENTVAGDMAITIFIQGILTFCIASGMVHVDLRKNKVDAFPYPWPDTAWGTVAKKDPEATRWLVVKWWRKFNNDQGFSRGLHFFSGSDVNDIFNLKLTRRQFFQRLCWSIWKGSVLSVIYFFILWPISIAIVAPIWEHDQLAGKFTAPLIKAVYGAVYGLIQNPVCAMIAMGSEDSVRHHRAERQRERFQNPEKSAMTTTAAERVSMLPGKGPASVLMEERCSSGLLLGIEGSPGSGAQRKTSTRRVDSLRRSLDGLAPHASQSPPSPTEPSSAGLAWRSTDVHRRHSLDLSHRRSRYDSQTPTRSVSVTAGNRYRQDSGGTPRSKHNSTDYANSSPETDASELAPPRRALVPMRRLTEASIVIDNNILTDL